MGKKVYIVLQQLVIISKSSIIALYSKL